MNITKEQFIIILEQAAIVGQSAIAGMIDGYPCGGAWLEFSGHSDFVKLFKKYAEENRGGWDLGEWRMSKGYPRGFHVSFFKVGSQGYQSMDMDIAKYQACVKEFAFHNIPASIHSYID